MTVFEIKQELLKHCNWQVENRYSKIKQTIADIEESLLQESKSSSGDKHETGRAMLQIDRENTGKQLQEVEKIVALLKKVDIKSTSDYVRLGSLARTNHGVYFVSISIGNVAVNDSNYLCVALNSPIGMMFSGKKKGDFFEFNGKSYEIMDLK